MSDPEPRLERSSAALRRRAIELRHRATPAEARLWQQLRGRKLGVKVRRQQPIGPFIADFCIPERRLVIEIDGAVHADQCDRDAERTTILEAAGYRVVRFTNEQVLEQMETVLAELRTLLAE